MSASQIAKVDGRENAAQLDANDPLKSFRKEFLIPPRASSGMGLPILYSPTQYTYWQFQTGTTAMALAFIFAETPWDLSQNGRLSA